MDKTPQIYQKNLQVEKSHLDNQQHVNNVQYVQWVQDIAEEHWESRATPEQKREFFWVVVKHEIDYKRQAFLNDQLSMQTYVDETTHVTSLRHVIIKNAENDQVIVEAKTVWCLMNAETKKPAKISEEMIGLFQQ